MICSIVESIIGFYVFNEENNLIDFISFPKKAEKIVSIISKLWQEEIVPEIGELIARLKNKDYTIFIFEDNGLARKISENFNVKIIIENPSKAGTLFRSNINSIAYCHFLLIFRYKNFIRFFSIAG